MAYRFYVADSLQNIPQNQYTTKRLYDIIYGKEDEIIDGDEIAADIIKRAGLSFGG